MYKGVGVRFADFVIETKIFYFHRAFKNGGVGPSEPPQPLWIRQSII